MTVYPTQRPRDRILHWDGCLNVRDLGGYLSSTQSRRTRWRALIRSDDLCRLTPAGLAAVVAYGIRTIVDIRFPSEVARAAHPFSAEPEAMLQTLDFLGRYGGVKDYLRGGGATQADLDAPTARLLERPAHRASTAQYRRVIH